MPKFFTRSSDTPELALTISARTFFKIIALIFATVLLLAMFRAASHALVLIFTAVFLALALNAPVSWVSRHLPGGWKGRRGLATALSTLLVLLLLGAFLASVVPPIIDQTKTLINQAPQLVRDIQNENSDLGQLVQHYNLSDQVNNISDELKARLESASGAAVSTLGSITSSAFAVLTIIVLTFMMLVEGPGWLKFGKQLVPERRRATAERLSQDMYKVIKGYVNGQVLLAATAAILLLPGLLIFDVSFAVALMGVVFICGLIPMVGHIIGAVIVTFVAIFTSPLSALGILLYYLLYQQIENYVIQPRIQATATNMSPLLVFMSVVIGVSFSGLLGGLVAIPIAGCIRVVVLEYLHSRDLIAAPARTKATNKTK